MSGQTQDLEAALAALTELDAKMSELQTRASLLREQKPDVHQKVRELTLDPAINSQTTRLMARMVKVASLTELVGAVDDIKRLTSTLDGILLSPQVEDLVASARRLSRELGLQMRTEVQSWLRNASKDATEDTLNQIGQMLKNDIDKSRALNLLKPQFKMWMTHKSTSLLNLRETSSQLLGWTKEIDSGFDVAISLDVYLSKGVKEEGSKYARAKVLADTLFELGMAQLEGGAGRRITEAPTYWAEFKTGIEGIWREALRWIAYADSLLGQLLDEEKVLFEKYVESGQFQLITFGMFVQAVSTKIHDLTELRKIVNAITLHVKSVEGIDQRDTADSLIENLKRLSRTLPDPATAEAFDSYLDSLKMVRQDYERWEISLNDTVVTMRNEAESWLQLCVAQTLGNYASRIGKICEGLQQGTLLANLFASRSQLSGIYKEISEELKQRGDPVILQSIVRVRAQRGAVSLSDLEAEVKKVKSDVTKEGILSSLADLESNKLVKVEVRV